MREVYITAVTQYKGEVQWELSLNFLFHLNKRLL